jgi:hypothetical protein
VRGAATAPVAIRAAPTMVVENFMVMVALELEEKIG